MCDEANTEEFWLIAAADKNDKNSTVNF